MSGACPAGGFDPYRHAGMHAALAAHRREQPVFHDPVLDAWVVTRYADVVAVFRDTDRFSARVALAPVAITPAVAGPVLRAGGYAPVSSNADLDPPDHARIRRKVFPLLGPRRIEQLEPRVRQIVAAALDRLPSTGRVELVAELTWELPVRVLFALLDLPDEDIGRIKAWAEHFLVFVFGRPDADAQVAAANGLVAWRNYCAALVARRMVESGDDLVSDLIRAHREDPAGLTVPEIESYVQGLLVAGHETTTHQATNAIRLLLLDPTRWAALADRTLVAGAVEECIRMESSVVAWRRRALVDVEIGGVTIPAGATVLLSLASGNRDEERFSDPDRWILGRPNAKANLSFGHGIHFCIGHPLARLELNCLLEEMPRRFPGMRLADEPLEYTETISFRGPKRLWVEMAPSEV